MEEIEKYLQTIEDERHRICLRQIFDWIMETFPSLDISGNGGALWHEKRLFTEPRHIIAQQCMEGILIGISNGIHSLQDSALTDEAVIKEDVPELEDKQGMFFPSILYISAPPAFCRFNEISGSGTILAGLKIIGKYSVPDLRPSQPPPALRAYG